VVVALLGASVLDPCQLLQNRLEGIQKAASASPERLEQLHSQLETGLGRPLLLQSERSLDPLARADLIERRARATCALQSRLSGISIQPANRDRLKQILDRPEFAGARMRNPDWLARWVRRLGEWLESLFEGQEAQSFAGFTRALVLGLALAAGAAGLIRLLRKVRAPSAAEPQAATAQPLLLEEPSVHLSLAQAALSTDAREAIRQGLLALLSWLEKRRLAQPNRAKTNRELVNDLPAHGASAKLSETVGTLLNWYDRAFYSLSVVPQREAGEFIDQISALQSDQSGEAS
jgi:hypothetical protein